MIIIPEKWENAITRFYEKIKSKIRDLPPVSKKIFYVAEKIKKGIFL